MRQGEVVAQRSGTFPFFMNAEASGLLNILVECILNTACFRTARLRHDARSLFDGWNILARNFCDTGNSDHNIGLLICEI